MTTVGAMKQEMAAEVEQAAERCDIMVAQVHTMWPICAMSAFLDACQRLEALEKASDEVLRTYMPIFPDSRAVDDCLVGLAAARSRLTQEVKP